MSAIINGLRLLLAARKSRAAKGDDAAVQYERQDHRARTWAEDEGHAVIHATTDTVSSQTPPWKRRELGPWMRDAAKLALYDAILISDTDRLSRGTDEDFHYIEHWAIENGKRIIVANGPQFPPREGPMGESDRYQWIAQKRAARTYWESVRDKHADTREIIRANGGAIGKPPFGYRMGGTKLHKTFVIDPVTGPLAHEAFTRMAQGRTATSIAEWLTSETGSLWRVKRVTEMIKRTTYLGERDGHTFQPLVTQQLWDSANAAMGARSYATGGRRGTHEFSGVIYCDCGDVLYHHLSTRNGKPVGVARYRCGKGRRAVAGETKCSSVGLDYAAVNAAVDAYMAADESWPWVTTTTGGDAARQAELASIKAEMNACIARGDMGPVANLAAKYAALDAMPAEPIKTVTTRRLNTTIGELWQAASLTDRRTMLGDRRLTASLRPDGTIHVWDASDAASGLG